MSLWAAIIHTLRRREQRPLTAVQRADGIELLVQASRKPVLRDDWPDGFDYVCGHCKKMVIASCVTEGQVWDLAFQCFRCKGVSLSPVLPPERALPRCVVPPPGRTDVTNGIDLQRTALVGQAAVDRRQVVAGVKGATFGYVANPPPPPEVDAKFLDRVIEDVRQLLGSTFEAIEQDDRLWHESTTPTKPRHRLMVMVEALRFDITSFGTAAPACHVDYLMELLALLQSLRRWQKHPFWSELVRGLDNDYRHTVMLIAAATQLEDAGNSVEFQRTGDDRTPDLFLVLNPRERVAVEVKMPERLKASSVALGYDKLLQVVDASMKSAGTGPSDQLSPRHPAMLVIGSFQTWPSDLGGFERAATYYFREVANSGEYKHVLGVGLLSFVTLIHRDPAKTSSQPALKMTLVANPGYEGSVKLKTETPPHLVRPPG
ncbi:MAG TPA: hypothetical protein VNJ06_03110 [Gemmatimonadales bacterium]|nr:hypothetical protein [Gemmatimonadales bacterium]